MDVRALAGWVMAALTVLLGSGFFFALQPASGTVPSRRVAVPESRFAFPPPPPARADRTVTTLLPRSVLDLDREIARLGAASPAPFDPVRENFLRTTDLHRFALDLLPRAVKGDGAAQYHIYLALEQCVLYLRLDNEESQGMYERQLMAMANAPADERMLWEREYNRCRGFAGGGAEPLAAALGAQRPGGYNEYASVWFERSAVSGYPLAQAERALRSAAYGEEQRRRWLESSVASADPAVYWVLFIYGVNEDPPDTALSWLIVACRAGMDCSEDALWYRGAECNIDTALCQRGESALEHYWYALPTHLRTAAWARAADIERQLGDGEWSALPWPQFGALSEDDGVIARIAVESDEERLEFEQPGADSAEFE